jgi:hypothetical protein
MNINLVYEGKDYNFDIPNGVTIAYLRELSSKIFNSEKELLDLIYNNKKVNNNDDNILIRDLIPEGETNAVLTVQLNKKVNSPKDSKKIPLVNLRQKSIHNTIKEDENESDKVKIDKDNNNNNDNDNGKSTIKKLDKKKIKLFEPLVSKEIKKYISNNTNNSKVKLGVEKINYNLLENDIVKKMMFEMTYIKKYNELISLIKEFNEKTKQIYLILYKKCKKSGSINNSISNDISSAIINNTSRSTLKLNANNNSFYELSLYEKKVINFLEKQILYYKNLLETIKNYDNNNINYSQLNEFYNKLIIFNSGDNKNFSLELVKPINPIKLSNALNKRLFSSNSTVNLSTSLNSKKSKLPFLKNKSLNSILKKESNRSLLKNTINQNNSANNINNKLLNDTKEIKIKQNNSINNEIRKTNTVINTFNNKDKILSPKTNINSLEMLSEKGSNKSNNNIISPLSFQRDSFNTFRNKNVSEKESNNIEEKNTFKNENKEKNSPETRMDFEDIKKGKKIKEINISSMTINNSNFTLEKISSSRKNKRNPKNKFDFII